MHRAQPAREGYHADVPVCVFMSFSLHLGCLPSFTIPDAVQRGRDMGFLMNPGDGAVTALQFFTPAAAASPTHLLNGR